VLGGASGLHLQWGSCRRRCIGPSGRLFLDYDSATTLSDLASGCMRRGDMTVPLAGLPPGAIFAGYRIEERVGRGGMGVIYRATESRPERTVALKVVAPELAADADFRARFLRESQIAASIEHPHVVPVSRVGEEDGVLFIAMRFIGGRDLAALIAAEGRLEPSRVARIVDQIADALDTAHEQGLVHRDVKPANVLVERRRRGEHVYLTDFGLTKSLATNGRLTGTGMTVGTTDYMAPEQFEGGRLDARADVYSLGCVLFEALTTRVPYERSGQAARMYAHLTAPPPTVSDLVPGVSPTFDTVVARALAKSPDDRYPSAGDLASAALAAAEGRSVRRAERSVASGEAAPTRAKSTKAEPPTQKSPSAPDGARQAAGEQAGLPVTSEVTASEDAAQSTEVPQTVATPGRDAMVCEPVPGEANPIAADGSRSANSTRTAPTAGAPANGSERAGGLITNGAGTAAELPEQRRPVRRALSGFGDQVAIDAEVADGTDPGGSAQKKGRADAGAESGPGTGRDTNRHDQASATVQPSPEPTAPKPGAAELTPASGPPAPKDNGHFLPNLRLDRWSAGVASAARPHEPEVADAEHPTKAARRSGRSVLAAIVAAVAGVGLVVTLTSGGGSASAATKTARSGPLTLSYRSPWRGASAPSAGTFALDSVGALSPISLSSGGTTLTAGTLTKSAPIPGAPPPGVVARYGQPTSTAAAQVAGNPGKRFAWNPTVRLQIVAFVLPTDSADLAIFCSGPSSATAALQSCSELAAKAKVSGERLILPGPDAHLGAELTTNLRPVAEARAHLNGLSGNPISRRSAPAKNLAATEITAATALSAMAVPNRSRPVATALISALKREAAAFRSLANAAEHHQRAAYARARTAALAADQSLASALSGIRAAGFAIPTFLTLSLSGLPAPPHASTPASPAPPVTSVSPSYNPPAYTAPTYTAPTYTAPTYTPPSTTPPVTPARPPSGGQTYTTPPA
jgi:serine/threonine protein kinase